MNCRRPLHSAPGVSPAPARRRTRKPVQATATFDAFVSGVYLPHIRFRKRSWQVDERIVRQHLSPAFGHREFTRIDRDEVEARLQTLSVQGLAPTTCNRILAEIGRAHV